MSSAYSNQDLGRIWKLETRLRKMLDDGHIDINGYRIALSALIAGDNIVRVPEILSDTEGAQFHVTGNAESLEKAITELNAILSGDIIGKNVHPAGSITYPLNPEVPIMLQNIQEMVKPVCLKDLGDLRKADDLYNRFPNIASPISAIYFATKFRSTVEQGGAYVSIWRAANGDLWDLMLSKCREGISFEASKSEIGRGGYNENACLLMRV